MKAKDILWLGVKGMSERKLRTALTVLSVVIGVAAIVALISLVGGVSATISKELSSIGPSTIYMTARGSTIFTDADVAEIESFPNVSTVVPVLSFSGTTSLSGTSVSATIYGVDNSSLSQVMGGVNLYEGSTYNDSQVPEAVVGYSVAFPTSTQLAPSVTLNEPIYVTATSGSKTTSITLVPVGILKSYGSAFFVSPDTSIFIPLSEAESLIDKYSYNILIVKATNTSTAGSVDTLLSDVYGSKASVLSVEEITSTVSSITGTLGLLLGGIAGISLIVAGISILSIMMVSVAERTHEIGILKSIGFKKRDVLMLFLSEALIIGLAGGVIGVVLGGSASYAVPSLLSSGTSTSSNTVSASTSASTGSGFRGGGGAGGFGGGGGGGDAVFVSGGGGAAPTGSTGSSAISSFSPVITPTIVVGAILLAVIVSVLASLYPAWKASTIDPIRALRTE